MADPAKLRRNKNTLGSPPPASEASGNLEAPEVAPVAAPSSPTTPVPKKRIDGRTLRRSGRTVQFATRVTPDFDFRIREIAERDDLLIVQVLERALALYVEKNGS